MKAKQIQHLRRPMASKTIATHKHQRPHASPQRSESHLCRSDPTHGEPRPLKCHYSTRNHRFRERETNPEVFEPAATSSLSKEEEEEEVVEPPLASPNLRRLALSRNRHCNRHSLSLWVFWQNHSSKGTGVKSREIKLSRELLSCWSLRHRRVGRRSIRLSFLRREIASLTFPHEIQQNSIAKNIIIYLNSNK